MQAKIRREAMRWQLLSLLYKARPYSAHEIFIGSVIRDIWSDATDLEIRCELDYLADRELIKLDRSPSGIWHAELNRVGIDLVEYTIPCEPGIARPDKYWTT